MSLYEKKKKSSKVAHKILKQKFAIVTGRTRGKLLFDLRTRSGDSLQNVLK